MERHRKWIILVYTFLLAKKSGKFPDTRLHHAEGVLSFRKVGLEKAWNREQKTGACHTHIFVRN